MLINELKIQVEKRTYRAVETDASALVDVLDAKTLPFTFHLRIVSTLAGVAVTLALFARTGFTYCSSFPWSLIKQWTTTVAV